MCWIDGKLDSKLVFGQMAAALATSLEFADCCRDPVIAKPSRCDRPSQPSRELVARLGERAGVLLTKGSQTPSADKQRLNGTTAVGDGGDETVGYFLPPFSNRSQGVF
jgi:hypothetical protein